MRDFQKLLFLYCQESDAQKVYEFVPYRFGAFSFTSYADRRKLIAYGLIGKSDDCWDLTNDGANIARRFRNQSMQEFARNHQGIRGKSLVAQTYRRFPFYATRSTILVKILGNDREALSRIEAERSRHLTYPLSTIGYEGRTVEGYLNVLLRAGVTILCDVRRNAMSRKYGFSKRTLAKACKDIGIRYIHLPELGIPPEERRNLKTRGAYQRLFSRYQKSHLSKQEKALASIRSLVQSGERVSLTCFERMPQLCHRHCVAAALEAELVGMGLRARHL